MKPFRCALIGADTLLIECGELLRARGHEIVAVAAGSPRVGDWAARNHIAVHDAAALDELADQMRAAATDYLFAITHLALLPTSVIGAAGRMAINFHDGPLPEYAGLNTPVWGILRGETEWGVTWHRIDEGIDTGEVLVQRRFAVAARETSLSLNTRNFEAALDSFTELLDRLETGHGESAMQHTDAVRAVFHRADRPDGVLDFSKRAEDVDRVVRALHFGPHPNTVAAAVVWNPVAALNVGASTIVAEAVGAPGTVVAANEAGLTVACSAGAVVLSELRWLSGAPCTATDFLQTVGSAVGQVLPQLSADQRRWLCEFSSTQCDEATTVAALSALSPAVFPWPLRSSNAGPSDRARVDVPLSSACTPHRMTEALTSLLGRLTPDGATSFAVAQPPVPDFARSLICTESPIGSGAVSWRRDLVARTPQLAGRGNLSNCLGLQIGVRLSRDDAPLGDAIVVVQPAANDDCWEVEFASGAVDGRDAAEFARCLAVMVAALGAGAAPSEVTLLPADVTERVVHEWNATDTTFDSACVHELIARQIAAHPDRQAVVCGEEAVTYEQLGERAQRLAVQLQQAGVEPDSLVGLHVGRSVDLVVAVLAVLRAGGAYVPLDPTYPADRLRYMLADSGARFIVCRERDRARLPLPTDDVDRVIIAVDGTGLASAAQPQHVAQPHNLAYCIYTSGSAGSPKGVLVEHRNVANLFRAIDAIVQPDATDSGTPATWCAVTSLSFDISVLELLYTLARGYRVVLAAAETTGLSAVRKPMNFSLFYFSADATDEAAQADHGNKYRLLLEGARFADANDFSAVWTPERHFHAFGGLYPNPAITATAVAAITERIAIRAGSVVLPLHHPIELTETWSMVDNLSNGRVGVSFASGWQPNDFVLQPENYKNAKAKMFEGIEQVRQLWRGDTLTFPGADGTPVSIATLPRPVQAELPMWITTAGDPESFASAGKAGTNLLTHLVGQSIEQLAPKITAYRAARAAAGHDPATGTVTLMVHTFVAGDETTVRTQVREPLRRYLNTSFELLREHAWSFPTFRRHDGAAINGPADLADDVIAELGGDDLAAVLDFATDRYYESSGLFGTPEQTLPLIQRLHEIGVDEVACLVDFGIASDTVLAHLPHLARLRELATSVAAPATTPLADVVIESGTTHMQCTPSMARMLTLDPAMRAALGTMQHLLVGGEALPVDLARELQALVGGTVSNMYGPTETTVWSSAWQLPASFDWTSIGTPLANTRMYVLDRVGQPTPVGVAGHLWIAGAGVARGYHQRDELTKQHFAPDPFRGEGRMYRTGDLARWREQSDGSALLEFLGRADQQVKLRGHRIELEEIEAELRRLPDVSDCAATVIHRNDDAFDQLLMAYVVTTRKGFEPETAREQLRQHLPEAMVPHQIVVLPMLPRTPNGKLDRRALPKQLALRTTRPAPPTSTIEQQVLADWRDVLHTSTIGIDDNFFDVGGHSLLVVRLHRQLQRTLERAVALTDLYRFPTVRTFAASLAANPTSPGQTPSAIESALDRAARRRASSRSRS